MAGDVVYADLNIPGAGSSSRLPQGSPYLSPPLCPRWHRIAVGAGWAGNIILTAAVIVLGVWVSQLRGSGEERTRGTQNMPENSEASIGSSTECSFCLKDFRSRLKPILCEPHSFPVGAGCKLCPRDWQLRGDKCYWLSKGSNNWNRSWADCRGKSSQLLVLHSQEELDAIQNVTHDANSAWIGLKVMAPGGNGTWVDGSPLDPPRFPVSDPVNGNSCGWIKGSRIQWETCDAVFRWICQRDAAVI